MLRVASLKSQSRCLVVELKTLGRQAGNLTLAETGLLTLFWGGEPGQRPAFLVTTDGSGPNKGVGAGKTTLITKCSELCGGFLSTSQTESIETLKKRILSQANDDACPRAIVYDNVKTRRFSSAELESLITARQISGHRMYLGNGAVPNLHTIAITINGASLSSDLAKRCIVITLADAVKSQTWLQSLNEFIDQNRWAIIGDIGHLLTSDAHPLPDEGSTRWAAWEHGVLSRVNQPEEVRTQIVAKQGSVDDDSANDQEFVSHIEENMERFKIYPSGIARIQHHDMHTLLKEFLGQSVGKNVVTKKVEAFGIPCLHQVIVRLIPSVGAGHWPIFGTGHVFSAPAIARPTRCPLQPRQPASATDHRVPERSD